MVPPEHPIAGELEGAQISRGRAPLSGWHRARATVRLRAGCRGRFRRTAATHQVGGGSQRDHRHSHEQHPVPGQRSAQEVARGWSGADHGRRRAAPVHRDSGGATSGGPGHRPAGPAVKSDPGARGRAGPWYAGPVHHPSPAPHGQREVVAEVGVRTVASHRPGAAIPVLAIAETAEERTERRAEITDTEPGWTRWMVSHFHYDPVWWDTQGEFTESKLLPPVGADHVIPSRWVTAIHRDWNPSRRITRRRTANDWPPSPGWPGRRRPPRGRRLPGRFGVHASALSGHPAGPVEQRDARVHRPRAH
jgi:hypothetical protein